MQEIGIGVVGLGRLGYVHAVNAARNTPRARLTAVCDRDEELARRTAAELGCACYTDIEDMLADKAVNAVCVATPTAHHVAPVEAVVRSGKSLFCEKPLADNLKNTLHLVKLIGGSGIKCQIGFQRRFDPAYAEAARLIREGAIGRPVYISGCSRDPFPPPPWACDPAKGGGLFIDMLLHDFDVARFLLQDEADSVYAEETNLVVDGKGVNRFADNVAVSLRFRGGALAAFHASMHAEYGYDVRTEVFGARGNLLIGGLNRTEVTLCTREGGISRPETFQTDGNIPHFMSRFREAYIRELAGFAACVLDDTPPPVSADDALAAFKTSLAAAESAGRREPVSIR